MKPKKILWIRKLSCGHERACDLMFLLKDYEKPEIGEECYCRECWKSVKVVEVYEDE
jgi:hypothetical protein